MVADVRSTRHIFSSTSTAIVYVRRNSHVLGFDLKADSQAIITLDGGWYPRVVSVEKKKKKKRKHVVDLNLI